MIEANGNAGCAIDTTETRIHRSIDPCRVPRCWRHQTVFPFVFYSIIRVRLTLLDPLRNKKTGEAKESFYNVPVHEVKFIFFENINNIFAFKLCHAPHFFVGASNCLYTHTYSIGAAKQSRGFFLPSFCSALPVVVSNRSFASTSNDRNTIKKGSKEEEVLDRVNERERERERERKRESLCVHITDSQFEKE